MSRACFFFVRFTLLCTMGQMGDGGYRCPPWALVRSVGLWHGGLCELWRSVSGFEGVVQFYMFYMPVLGGMSLEVECISSDREVELIALGDAELRSAEYVFEWLIRA